MLFFPSGNQEKEDIGALTFAGKKKLEKRKTKEKMPDRRLGLRSQFTYICARLFSPLSVGANRSCVVHHCYQHGGEGGGSQLQSTGVSANVTVTVG